MRIGFFEQHYPSTVRTPGQRPPTRAERRRRPRVQIVQPVRISQAASQVAGSEGLDEISNSVNVSGGGVYFTTSREIYAEGMRVQITFPFTPARDPVVNNQTSVVVRVRRQTDGLMGVAVRFLPAAAAQRAAQGQEAAALRRAAAGGAPPLVLALDGDALVRHLCRKTLEAAGYVVQAAETGEEALEALHGRVPATMLLDADTLVLSAAELCRLLKSGERLKNVPLVLLTRGGSLADYSLARELGAIVCLPKPLQAGRLLQVVRMLTPPHATQLNCAA